MNDNDFVDNIKHIEKLEKQNKILDIIFNILMVFCLISILCNSVVDYKQTKIIKEKLTTVNECVKINDNVYCDINNE